MFKIWTVEKDDHCTCHNSQEGDHLVDMDSITGLVHYSCPLGSINGQTDATGHLSDFDATDLDCAMSDDLVHTRELTLDEYEAWGV